MTNSPEKIPQIPREKPNLLEKLVATLIANLTAKLEKLTQKVRGNQTKNLREMFDRLSVEDQIKEIMKIEQVSDFVSILAQKIQSKSESINGVKIYIPNLWVTVVNLNENQANKLLPQNEAFISGIFLNLSKFQELVILAIENKTYETSKKS